VRFTLQDVGRLSAAIYTTASVLGAGVFFVLTVLTGDYSWVARVGGSAWVFLLSMIILMPTVTPWVRKRLEGQTSASE
jgi:cytochrome c biogenesis protein CcdA